MYCTAGTWHIRNSAALLGWISTKMCETAIDFFGWKASIGSDDVPNESSFDSCKKMDEMIVLRVFQDTTNKSFGRVFTSRQTVLNLVRSMRDQANNVFASSDGTYKLHEGGWTLVNFGTYMTRYERRSLRSMSFHGASC